MRVYKVTIHEIYNGEVQQFNSTVFTNEDESLKFAKDKIDDAIIKYPFYEGTDSIGNSYFSLYETGYYATNHFDINITEQDIILE